MTQDTNKSPAAVEQPTGDLPPLPEPWIRNLDAAEGSRDHFAADQMQDFARAAIAAHLAAQLQAAQPTTLTASEITGLTSLADRIEEADELPISIARSAARALDKLLQAHATHLARQSQPSTLGCAVPEDVRRALDRMCTPLDESRLSGATAQADARCMQTIKGFIDSIAAPAAQEVPPAWKVNADEAELYRDLTGDAMALGYDGIPAALEALRVAGVAQEALAQADDSELKKERDRFERMFLATCADLGLVNEALGLDPDDGGADPILEAIAELKAGVAQEVTQQAAPAAWMRDNMRECKTDSDVKHMASLEFGHWKEIAACYTIPLYLAPTTSTAIAPALASPISPDSSGQASNLPVVLEMPEGDERTAKVVWQAVRDGKRHLCIKVEGGQAGAQAVRNWDYMRTNHAGAIADALGCMTSDIESQIALLTSGTGSAA